MSSKSGALENGISICIYHLLLRMPIHFAIETITEILLAIFVFSSWVSILSAAQDAECISALGTIDVVAIFFAENIRVTLLTCHNVFHGGHVFSSSLLSLAQFRFRAWAAVWSFTALHTHLFVALLAEERITIVWLDVNLLTAQDWTFPEAFSSCTWRKEILWFKSEKFLHYFWFSAKDIDNVRSRGRHAAVFGTTRQL